MSKKQTPPVVTLLQTATVVVPAHVVPAAPVPEPVKRSPYEALVAELPGDPAAKAWLLENVEMTKSWGVANLQVPSDFLIALLDKAISK
jgi:hypothetical protein